jgi:TPR repeat protein
MNRTFKTTVAALTLAVSFAGSIAAGPFEDAATAYKKGNYAMALELIRPLAEEGNVAAQFNLGVMYQLSHGVPQDNEAAVNWYRKAAEQGLAEAQYILGVMYANGEGVPQDYAAAVDWYRKAAERGSAIAQYNLADMYRVGEGVLADNAVAASWYRLQSGRARVRPSSKQSWDHVR